MQKLIEIDQKITEQLKLLKTVITKDDFQILCEFDLNNLGTLETHFKKTEKISGIYLFEIYKSNTLTFDEWICKFKFKFRGNKEGDNEKVGTFLRRWTPNIIKGRLNNNFHNEKEWIPLYIGKSANISKRIKDHIFSMLGIPPFALKLLSRKNLNDEKFRIKYIAFPPDISEYETLAVELEKELRKVIKPLSGK